MYPPSHPALPPDLRAVLFDLDGTLLDSFSAHFAAYQVTFMHFNIPTSLEVQPHEGHPFAQLHGRFKDPYVMMRYAEKLGIGSQDYELVDVLPVDDLRPVTKGYYISST
mgnify:CR=1 FL=1